MTDVDGDADIHPRKRVATYRAYHLDSAGRITKPALVFEAPDDITATARVRALVEDGDQLEIWEGSRQVGRTLTPGGHP